MSQLHRTVWTRGLVALVAAAALAFGVAAPVTAQQRTPEPDAKPVPAAPADLGTTDRWVVEFEASADLRPAGDIDGKTAKGEFVVSRLQSTAAAAQQDALALVAAVPEATAQGFWLRNVMIVTGPDSLLDQLRRLAGVRDVRPERVYPLVKPVDIRPVGDERLASPEWGVSRVGADLVWDQGILGAGVVVANIDTGVDYLHPALVEQYRGNLGAGGFSHDYNWWDPTGICGAEPCDNAAHGTHTMGTIVGGDGPGPAEPDIGVAPGAQWIAAKGCEDFGCSESALLSSGEFVLAPTDSSGGFPDPSLAPDIVNNSWGGGPGDAFYLDVVAAWRAAGIVPVFSSGNPGPGCGDGGSPGDYNEAFSAGATDIDDLIADFSGRGPSPFGKVNPDVSAPGVDVVSSVPGGGYASFSGTSMAAPHVAGSLALVMSGAPGLVGDVDGATEALRSTAVDIEDLSCGGTAELNNVYGDGRIDAEAAVLAVATGGLLTGRVTGPGAIAGARVTANDGIRTRSVRTDAAGIYELFLAEGTYMVTAEAFGFDPAVAFGVGLVANETTTRNFSLTRLPFASVGGLVKFAGPAGNLRDAQVKALGTPVPAARVQANGQWRMQLPIGSYTLEASGGPCVEPTQAVLNLTGSSARRDFTLLPKLDAFGHNCRTIDPSWADTSSQTALFGDDALGRLKLPFVFPYYGSAYSHVLVDSNGYLAFENPGFSVFDSVAIPNPQPPNAAIFGMWQDLIIDEDSEIRYGFGADLAVFEYLGVRQLFGSGRFDMQIQLHRDGVIDLVYGDTSQLRSGAEASIGIEGPGGRDGLRLGFRTSVAKSNTAWRFDMSATSTLRGKVTDRNTGLPIAGATVTAEPGGRKATTGPRGNYQLRLAPGDYQVRFTKGDYRPLLRAVTIGTRPVRQDASLRAGIAELSPLALSAAVELGESATETLTLTNSGSARLRFSFAERETGFVPPDLPPVVLGGEPVIWYPEWAQRPLPAGLADLAVDAEVHAGALTPIITDPAGDAIGIVDVTTVSAGAAGGELSLAIDFTPATPIGQVVGYLFLDTDQNPATGLPADFIGGLPTQDVGMEFVVDLFPVPFDGVAVVVDTNTFAVVAVVPVAVDGQRMAFDIPLAALRDDGSVNVAGVLGDPSQPTDWVPDVGHGTVRLFRDTPWMQATPATGVLAPGGTVEIAVRLGGEGIQPAEYAGDLVLISTDPVSPQVTVAVNLEVALPADFGTVAGSVVDAITGAPVQAAVTLDAIDGGQPYVVTTTAAADGSYQLSGPAGSWTLDAAADGYVPASGPVTITAGSETSADLSLDPEVPLIEVGGSPLAFTVATGGSDGAELTIGNVGFADLDWQIFEIEGPGATIAAAERGARTSTTAATSPPSAVEPRVGVGPWLVFMDTPPWGSSALLEVLDANGVLYDVAGSSDMGSINLADYETVILSNDQPQPFYNSYADHLAAFDTYVLTGGILWVGAATQGFNSGRFAGAPLPGGVGVVEGAFEERNDVVLAGHPTMVGVPNPFFGNFASHSGFDGLAPDAVVVATGRAARLPTVVEYPYGAGIVVATGQPLEFGFEFGEPTGTILVNLVPYLQTLMGGGDIPWVTLSPAAGTVAPGNQAEVAVTVDATGLDPGTYEGRLIVASNDPFSRAVIVPVTMEVSAAPLGIGETGVLRP